LQPKIYHVDEHQIAPDRIDQHAFYVIQKLRQAGHTAYLVGGGVRDLLLKQRPKDFDVSTSARPEEIRALFRNAILIGRRFRLAHIRFGKKVIEVSTFRAGATEEAELVVRDNVWGTEEQDVLRRDFTINGLFYDPESQKVIDYVDGYVDLEKRVLKTIGQPDVRFTQDPVRMIRLIKFCARFDFEIHPPTFEALLSCKGEILKSSSARIFEELLRMLESGASRSFFHLLNEYGLLKPLSPPLSQFLEQVDHFTYALLEKIDDAVKKSPDPIDRSLLLAALIFPFFEKLIQEKNKAHPLHLGQIADIAHRAIDAIFLPFFSLPRRMRGVIAFLLTAQYRLVPLDGKPVRRPRAPRDSSFPLALHLFKLRTEVQSELLPHYTLWTEASFASHQEPGESGPSPQRRRRRRRRRRSENPM
jgi:poly(A) polymerase